MTFPYRHLALSLLACCLMSVSVQAQAADDGQADLDKATELQLTASSLDDLDKVIELCDSALKKGLSKENEAFAKQLLGSTLYQHAEILTKAILQPKPDTRWRFLRFYAMKDLERVIKLDKEMAEAHMMIARLNALPEGNRKRAVKAATEAARLFEDDKDQRSLALLIKAQVSETDEARVAALAEAIKHDPNNSAAWQARALYYMGKGKFEEAIKDINSLLEKNDKDLTARLALAEALSNLKKYDEALEQIDLIIKEQPDSSTAYTLRARIHVVKEDLKAAIADLDKALKVNPDDVSALLMRGRLHQAEGNIDEARADVEKALNVRPGLVQGVLLRSMVAASEGRFDDAIDDMKLLVRSAPDNVEFRLQLAALYNGTERPRKAIEQAEAALKLDPENWQALRSRADAYLSIGKHAEAVADYEIAVKAQPEHSGILNNFAWVLATSPKDEVRNGKRSVELATKACEVTDFKQAHILSTLASAYAETGDFESAIKWSTKAVELGEGDVANQLKEELESYKKKKKWRELQQIEDKPERRPRGRRLDLDA